MKVPPDKAWRMLRVRALPVLPTAVPTIIPMGDEIINRMNSIKEDGAFHG